MEVGDTYYTFSTSSGPNNVSEMSTTNLGSWPQTYAQTTDALPVPGSWAEVGPSLTVWVPSATEASDRFYLFYAAYDPHLGARCIGVATSPTPAGPYTDHNRAPMVCQPTLGGSIDPDAFTDTDGHPYLIWKSDGHNATLWAAPMVVTAIGASLSAAPVALLSPDQGWESTVENPFMLVKDGYYDLLFSGGNYDSASYATGYAICSGPLGPCVEPGFGPIIASTPEVAGPGGASAFQDADGQTWMDYAAFTPPAIGYEDGGVRSLHIVPLCVQSGTVTVAPQSAEPSTLAFSCPESGEESAAERRS